MPLAFASILTSSVTLISTSTNLVVSGLMTSYGLAPMGMFELAPVGVPIAVVGIAYMFFVGRRLIPDRTAPAELIESFGVRSYLTEVLVLPDSPLAGKTLGQSGLGAELDLNVLRIVRDEQEFLAPSARRTLRAGDVLLVEGAREQILKIKDTAGIEIRADVELADPNLTSEETALVEALVPPGSPLLGRTLRGMRFRDRYDLQVLGLNRHGRNILSRLSRTALRAGDVLLVQGRRAGIAALEHEQVLSVLGAIEGRRLDRPRALRSAAIFAGAIAVGTFALLPLPVAVLLGAFTMLATRCAAPEDAYRRVEWRVVILIACMLALGAAMDRTGTATWVAAQVVGWVQGLHPRWLLTGFFFLCIALTQPMSNQAAAAVLLPIAIQTATQLGLEPRSFAMMIAVAASCSYLTPLEPACLMVYGPGRYRFFDFFRVGAPLTLLVYLVAILLVPLVWPLQG
jgi:di/tricarboxylate transporter